MGGAENIDLSVLKGKKLINIEKQYKDKKEYEYYDNSDKYWKLGMFYFNPNDRHIMVENRTAMGTTVNLATKAGMGLGIFAIVAIIEPTIKINIITAKILAPKL